MTSGQKAYHPKLADRASIAAAVKYINEKVNGTGLDFREDINGFHKSIAWMNFNEPGMLIVLASFDFSYYHDLEMVFYNVSYTNIPSDAPWWGYWTKDQLEMSEQEGPDGFEFRFNIGTHKEEQYIVRAKGFLYLFEHVSYRQ